jgi:hypothetical protein
MMQMGMLDQNQGGVDHDGDSSQYLHGAQNKAAMMQKFMRADAAPSLMGAGIGSTGYNQPISQSPTRVVVMGNMYDPRLVNLSLDPQFYLRMKEDVLDQCKRYGETLDVVVDGQAEGQVWVLFKNQQDAIKAVHSFTGKKFDDRPISCKYGNEAFFQNLK